MPEMSLSGGRLRNAAQEVWELGLSRTLFRMRWELRNRLPFGSTADDRSPIVVPSGTAWLERLPLSSPEAVARVMAPLMPAAALDRLRDCAEGAIRGDILCFSRWTASFGNPIDWHRNPLTGLSWDRHARWPAALADRRPGDVKFCWEAARFPQAYHLSRAAAFFPENRDRYGSALWSQIQSFTTDNPVGFGIQWASGQETAFRLLAWLFSARTHLLIGSAAADASGAIATSLAVGANQIEKHIAYVRNAVYNNHLVSEAVALFAAAVLLPDSPRAEIWRALGRGILDEEADRQFYSDGGYIQQSHTYHRVALQVYLWAVLLARADGVAPPPAWIGALDRSLDFLSAQQNPLDGRLPNYGANDGALPSVLSTCEYGDMRPTLQTISLLVRGRRLYDRGPWDEEAAWLLGAEALEAPCEPPVLRSRSFPVSGHHVLRRTGGESFATFRCGTLRDRFSQIDMLNVDIWWRGHNVLADGGSYRYNAAPEWLAHFMRTPSHNTVSIDGRDQMLHYRPFKVIFLTSASLQRFEDNGDHRIAEGEHYGYRRHPGGCVHGRTVLSVKDELWIVVDRITGSGAHDARLHWLGGDFPWAALPARNGMRLTTPNGAFVVSLYDGSGAPLDANVASGVEAPAPRGWLSRYYGERTAVPSLAATQSGPLPAVFVSVLSAGPAAVSCTNRSWSVGTDATRVCFDVTDGRVDAVRSIP